MIFSSIVFIFIFLPFVLTVYYVLLRKSRSMQNIFLLCASLFFYAWGEPRFVLVMMASIVINWIAGGLVDRYRKDRIRSRIIVAADVAVNILILFIFKYLMFTVENINLLTGSHITVPSIALPIGISFFTFQAISYVIDVYREKGQVQKSVLNVGLYISFFPQLIAGPIVRYETIADQIMNRKETFEGFSEGVHRFIIGLAKKVIIANNMAIVADGIYGVLGEGDEISTAAAWLAAIAYTLQIYFDFSGYSDMAIGLGRMFGFRFLENFDYPYISSSCTEFWRRWHISMGTWFRDYIYFPLGGSRVDSEMRHIFNLFVVWFCTGFWHGANWTFLCWGMMYFVLLVMEKNTGLAGPPEGGLRGGLRHVYTMFFVVCGWVLFRADSLGQAADMFSGMFSIGDMPLSDDIFLLYFRQYAVFIGAGIIASLPLAKKVTGGRVFRILCTAALLAMFAVSISYIVKGSYNPFIYFNF